MTTVLTQAPEQPKAQAPADATPAAQDVSKGQEQQAPIEKEQPPAKEGEAAPVEPVVPQGAPEKYEFKTDDGSVLDAETVKPFEAALRNRNLTNEAAQELFASGASVFKASLSKQIDSTMTAWAAEIASDPVFGGDAGKANLAIARKGLDAVIAENPGLGKLLDLPANGGAGLGNHIAMAKLGLWIGTRISEDKVVVGNGAQAMPSQSDGEILFPDMKKKA